MVIFPIDRIVVCIISVHQVSTLLLFVLKELLGIRSREIVDGKIQWNARKVFANGIKSLIFEEVREIDRSIGWRIIGVMNFSDTLCDRCCNGLASEEIHDYSSDD